MNIRQLDILSLFDRKRRLYRRVYATPDGRAVLDDIMAKCRSWREERCTDQTGRIDPLALALAEGNRQIATHIIKHLGMSDVEMHMRLKSAQGGYAAADGGYAAADAEWTDNLSG